MDRLDFVIYDNTLLDWSVTAGIVLFVLLVVAGLRALLRRRLRLAAETQTDLDDLASDLVSRTRLYLIFFVVLFLAARTLTLDPAMRITMRYAAIITGLMQLGLWGTGLIEYWLGRYRRLRMAEDPAAVTTVAAFGFFGKIGIWLILLLVALDNFGVEITAFITGLGIGGIAIALALQKILGDLFASLSIVLDKPFIIGDFIIVGDQMGTVQHVGLKTTRVRSLSGEQIIFSNSDLLGSRIRNFKRMTERRAVFKFGVLYKTSHEQLEKIPQIVRNIVESIPETRFDRAHFAKFGESALEFEVVYWLLNPDYNIYMDIQEKINLELLSRLRSLGVDIAFPTRTLIHEGSGWAATGDPRLAEREARSG